jgi:hypothetical protein
MDCKEMLRSPFILSCTLFETVVKISAGSNLTSDSPLKETVFDLAENVAGGSKN